MNTAYLDNQASTPIDPRVREVLVAALSEPGNAASEEHAFGWRAAAHIDRARAEVAELFGASPEEVIFTSGATEANNAALLGAAAAAPPGRRRLLVSAVEHKSVLEAARAAEEFGFSVESIPVRASGDVDLERLGHMIRADVAVVSVMAVNNEIGTIQPSLEIGRLARSVGAFFHVDATQAPMVCQIDVLGWGADAASLSGHKIYGPQGVGALFMSDAAPWAMRPRVFGGGQERGIRPGSVPVALCAAFGEAARLIRLEADEGALLASKRMRLLTGLRAIFPNLAVTAESAARHPGCLHVMIPGLSASDLLMRIQPKVAASTGSACASGTIGASHVLQALGLSREEADACLRFSVGRFTTDAEIDFALDVIAATALRLAA